MYCTYVICVHCSFSMVMLKSCKRSWRQLMRCFRGWSSREMRRWGVGINCANKWRWVDCRVDRCTHKVALLCSWYSCSGLSKCPILSNCQWQALHVYLIHCLVSSVVWAGQDETVDCWKSETEAAGTVNVLLLIIAHDTCTHIVLCAAVCMYSE